MRAGVGFSFVRIFNSVLKSHELLDRKAAAVLKRLKYLPAWLEFDYKLLAGKDIKALEHAFLQSNNNDALLDQFSFHQICQLRKGFYYSWCETKSVGTLL